MEPYKVGCFQNMEPSQLALIKKLIAEAEAKHTAAAEARHDTTAGPHAAASNTDGTSTRTPSIAGPSTSLAADHGSLTNAPLEANPTESNPMPKSEGCESTVPIATPCRSDIPAPSCAIGTAEPQKHPPVTEQSLRAYWAQFKAPKPTAGESRDEPMPPPPPAVPTPPPVVTQTTGAPAPEPVVTHTRAPEPPIPDSAPSVVTQIAVPAPEPPIPDSAPSVVTQIAVPAPEPPMPPIPDSATSPSPAPIPPATLPAPAPAVTTLSPPPQPLTRKEQLYTKFQKMDSVEFQAETLKASEHPLISEYLAQVVAGADDIEDMVNWVMWRESKENTQAEAKREKLLHMPTLVLGAESNGQSSQPAAMEAAAPTQPHTPQTVPKATMDSVQAALLRGTTVDLEQHRALQVQTPQPVQAQVQTPQPVQAQVQTPQPAVQATPGPRERIAVKQEPPEPPAVQTPNHQAAFETQQAAKEAAAKKVRALKAKFHRSIRSS